MTNTETRAIRISEEEVKRFRADIARLHSPRARRSGDFLTALADRLLVIADRYESTPDQSPTASQLRELVGKWTERADECTALARTATSEKRAVAASAHSEVAGHLRTCASDLHSLLNPEYQEEGDG